MKIQDIVNLIEEKINLAILDFNFFYMFGAQSEYDALDMMDNALERWSAISLYSNEIRNGISYKAGQIGYWGYVLFNYYSEVGILVVFDPEREIGLTLCRQSRLSGDEILKWREDFYYTASWRMHCSDDSETISYIKSWISLEKYLSDHSRQGS